MPLTDISSICPLNDVDTLSALIFIGRAAELDKLRRLQQKKSAGFDNQSMTNFIGWETIVDLQFENMIIKNCKLIWDLLSIDLVEIVMDNPYFQRKMTRAEGCQIDYLIQTKMNNLYVCEIKFSKYPVKINVIKEMKEKIKRLQVPKGYACIPVLIHVNGVHDRVIEKEYFKKIIDFKDIL